MRNVSSSLCIRYITIFPLIFCLHCRVRSADAENFEIKEEVAAGDPVYVAGYNLVIGIAVLSMDADRSPSTHRRRVLEAMTDDASRKCGDGRVGVKLARASYQEGHASSGGSFLMAGAALFRCLRDRGRLISPDAAAKRSIRQIYRRSVTVGVSSVVTPQDEEFIDAFTADESGALAQASRRCHRRDPGLTARALSRFQTVDSHNEIQRLAIGAAIYECVLGSPQPALEEDHIVARVERISTRPSPSDREVTVCEFFALSDEGNSMVFLDTSYYGCSEHVRSYEPGTRLGFYGVREVATVALARLQRRYGTDRTIAMFSGAALIVDDPASRPRIPYHEAHHAIYNLGCTNDGHGIVSFDPASTSSRHRIFEDTVGHHGRDDCIYKYFTTDSRPSDPEVEALDRDSMIALFKELFEESYCYDEFDDREEAQIYMRLVEDPNNERIMVRRFRYEYGEVNRRYSEMCYINDFGIFRNDGMMLNFNFDMTD